MSAPTYKELLELDEKDAKQLVLNYKGDDKIEFAKKVACVVRCHKPVDEKIEKHVGAISQHCKIEEKAELLKETAEKVAHLFLLANDQFPPSRDYVARSCIHIASKIYMNDTGPEA